MLRNPEKTEIGDLLEILGLLTEDEASKDEVAGWLTADDVFSRIIHNFELNGETYLYGHKCDNWEI